VRRLSVARSLTSKHSKVPSVREILHVGRTENMQKSGEGTLPCIEDLVPATARYLTTHYLTNSGGHLVD
jgi:hypothetical protein